MKTALNGSGSSPIAGIGIMTNIGPSGSSTRELVYLI
jgi:hypothetical protein